jgi:glycosyltransferase involved in cell wall biosynthesis
MNIVHFVVGKAKPESKNGIVKVVYHLARQQSLLSNHVEVWSVTDRTGEELKDGFVNRYFMRTQTRFLLDKRLRLSFEKLTTKDTIVHLHGNYIPEHAAIARYLGAAAIPYIVTCHGILSPGAHVKGKRRKYIFKHLFELAILRRAAGVQALGAKEEEAIRGYGVDSHKVFVIPNGIDFNAIPAADILLHQKVPGQHAEGAGKLLYIGRLDPVHKGLDLLLAGFSEACKEKNDLQLIIAGPDHKSGGSAVRGMIDQLGIAKKVLLLPAVYGTEKFKLLQAADLFIHPSRWEGMPLGVLEALACGKPCLVTKETNLAEYISRYNAGFVANLEPLNIAHRILEAFSPSVDLKDMGANARRMVKREFAWQKIAEDLCGVYGKYVVTAG